MNRSQPLRRCSQLFALAAAICAPALGQATPSDQHEVPRLKLYVRETRDIAIGEPVTRVTVIDPSAVAATVVSENTLHLQGVDYGETLVIITTARERRMFVVEVVGHPLPSPFASNAASRNNQNAHSSSGFVTLTYAPGLDGERSVLSEQFADRQNLGHSRLLRIEGDLFSYMRRGSKTNEADLGFNRLSVGYNSRRGDLTLLDSDVNVAPLSLYGFGLRGAQFTGREETRLRGLDIFLGETRPAIHLWGPARGRLLGAVVPVRGHKRWGLRAGAILVARRSGSSQPGIGSAGSSGTVIHADARYMPDERTNITGEIDFARGGLSWGTRLRLKRGQFELNGEGSHLDYRSPFIGIGAQSTGRTMLTGAISWQPSSRLTSTVSYSRVQTVDQSLVPFSRTLQSGTSYRPAKWMQLGLRLTDQQIAVCGNGFTGCFTTNTRIAEGSLGLSHKAWSDQVEGRYSLSHEGRVGSSLDKGYQMRNELRRNWGSYSATAFIDYTRSSETLTKLLLDHPTLLPPVLSRAFLADPVGFLLANRDSLGQEFLRGVELPVTTGLNAGLRFQRVARRGVIAGQIRWSSTDLTGRSRSANLLTSVNANWRLSETNSAGVNFARTFEPGVASSTVLSLSLTHRFGAGSGGFSLMRLLKLDRHRLEGRVFFDLNGDGRDDAKKPGVSGVRIVLDGRRATTTDANGRYRFNIEGAGEHHLTLEAEGLGEKLRTSTPTEATVQAGDHKKITVNFGVTNFGFVSGRIFNDAHSAEGAGARDAPGVGGVRILLRSLNPDVKNLAPQAGVTDGGGTYEIPNLPPGNYVVEIDLDTLPPDFRPPGQTSWPVTVAPLHGSYLDIPITAQRAVAGIVFVDKDGDGRFDQQKDEPVAGARVIAGKVEASTGPNGSYILRNLPAGTVEIRVRTPWGGESRAITVELGAEPTIRRGVNIPVTRQ